MTYRGKYLARDGRRISYMMGVHYFIDSLVKKLFYVIGTSYAKKPLITQRFFPSFAVFDSNNASQF